MEETRIDLRLPHPERDAEGRRTRELCFKINSTMPGTEESERLIRELFPDMGEGTKINPPLQVNLGNQIKIGRNCSIMYNFFCMSAGGVTIEDDVLIAANVSLVSNSHDFKERQILTCKPIVIKRNVWIGAGATILPGVTIGENSIVAAAAVVTKDVPPHTLVAGVPAKIIRDISDELK